jgi:hypothetical protein
MQLRSYSHMQPQLLAEQLTLLTNGDAVQIVYGMRVPTRKIAVTALVLGGGSLALGPQRGTVSTSSQAIALNAAVYHCCGADMCTGKRCVGCSWLATGAPAHPTQRSRSPASLQSHIGSHKWPLHGSATVLGTLARAEGLDK